MVSYKKKTLPSIDMSGKFPLRSLYTSPLMLSAKALKQKPWQLTCRRVSHVHSGKHCMQGCWKEGGSSKIGNTCGIICGTVAGASLVVATCFGCVLLIHFFDLFLCPLAVAGLGFKYFVTSSSLILGHPFEEALLQCFQKGGNLRVALQLMCKFDSIGSRANGIHEGCQFSQW